MTANLSVDATSGSQPLNADFVAELREMRRQISPSCNTAIKETPTASPLGHSFVGSRRSPALLDSSLVSELPSDGRRRTFAGQKSLSYEVNQFVQYQPSSGSSAERLRDYLDENEIKEFEIEGADGTGVSVWVPPATLGDRDDSSHVSRLSVAAAGRRASRVGGQRRAHFAEQRSFSCEAASSAPAATGHRSAHPSPGQTEVVGRRCSRETNLRLVRQTKTEAIDPAAEMSAAMSARDGLSSRRRDRPTPADAELGDAVYRSRHHQSRDSVEHGRGYSDFDSQAIATSGSWGRYSGDGANRKPTKESRPLERHGSVASGVDERDVDVSPGRRHTTGQVRHPDTGATKNLAAESKHFSGAPADTSERGHVLMSEMDKKTSDVVVDVRRKISPRRLAVDVGKDAERAKPTSTQHATAYHSRKTSDPHDKDR